MTLNKGLKQSTTEKGIYIVKFTKLVSVDLIKKKSCNFFIFYPILTNFLPKCRAQNVYSEKGHGAGKKGMALGEKGMARRHSKKG